MRLTIRSNLAMRTLMFCATHNDRIVRKHEIATACNASENHLAQVVNTLGQLGFIETQRGRAGGLRLAHPAEEIRVGAVLRAFEGTLPFAECFDTEANACAMSATCLLREALVNALEAFYTTMDRWTIADLVANEAAMEHLLQLQGRELTPACTGRKAAQEAGVAFALSA